MVLGQEQRLTATTHLVDCRPRSCWVGTRLEGSGKTAILGRAHGKAGMQGSFSSLTAPAGDIEPEAKTPPRQEEPQLLLQEAQVHMRTHHPGRENLQLPLQKA